MPLVVVPAPPPTAPPPPTQAASPRAGTIRATWTAPDGSVWDLSNTDPDFGWLTPNAIGGWGANPVEIVADPDARGGERVRHIRSLPRRLTWPLHIHGEQAGLVTHMLFVQRWWALMEAFTMTTHWRKPGVLRVARPDGSAREVEAFYEAGFEGEPGEGWVSANPVLTLYCPDGYWRDVTPVREPREYPASRPYLNPYPTVSSDRVFGATTIVNPGQVDAWPVWTVTGPATQLVAANNTLGEQFTLTYTLAAGQQLTMATRTLRVRGPAGQNLVDALNWPWAQVWPLRPRANDINYQVSGSEPGTSIVLEYYPRYEAA